MTDTFTYQASDGYGNSNIATVTITVGGVNDAPTITFLGDDTTTVDTPLVFSTGNGNAITIGDVDAGTAEIKVNIAVTQGTLTLAGTAGLTLLEGDGSADPLIEFTGTLSDINAALDGLVYTPNGGYVGDEALAITVQDLGSDQTRSQSH